MNTDKVIQLMNISESDRDNPNQGRVYSVEGICPTLTKMDGGGRQPHIVIYKKKIDVYGLSRTRDKKGKVTKRTCNHFVSCIHSTITGGIPNMWVLVAEVYGDTNRCDEGTQ